MSGTEVDDTVGKVEDTEVQNESIDDLFNAEPEKETAKVETEVTKEAVKADEEPKEEAETTAAEEKPVPLKALTEERRKRQEAEKRADEAEAKLKQQPEEEKIPDPVEDPEGYKTHMEDQRHLDALRIKVSMSRDLFIDQKDDYIEKENVFVELARKNPFLVQQMNASPNPAKFAYQTAVAHLETEKLRDPKYKETLKEEIRKEVLAELKLLELQKEQPKKKSALEVPDLTQATAAGKNSDKTEKLSELDDIMRGAPL